MKWVRLAKTHSSERQQSRTDSSANVRAVACTVTANHGFAETLEPVGIALAGPRRAELAHHTSHRRAVTTPSRRTGQKSPSAAVSFLKKSRYLGGKAGQRERNAQHGVGRQGPSTASLLMLLTALVPSRRRTNTLALSMFSVQEDWR